MKILALLMSLLLVITPSCAHAQPSPIAAKQDKPLILKINFETEVDDDSAERMEAAFMAIRMIGPDAVLIRINSPGGSVDAGWRIIRAIRSSPAPVHCVVDGEADSMAFIMLQACTTRGITDESRLLAHQPFVHLNSTVHIQDIQTILNYMQMLIDQVEIMCSKRMGMTLEDFRAKTAGIDWWLSSVSGLKYHAVDYVIGSVKEVVESLESTRSLPSP